MSVLVLVPRRAGCSAGTARSIALHSLSIGRSSYRTLLPGQIRVPLVSLPVAHLRSPIAAIQTPQMCLRMTGPPFPIVLSICPSRLSVTAFAGCLTDAESSGHCDRRVYVNGESETSSTPGPRFKGMTHPEAFLPSKYRPRRPPGRSLAGLGPLGSLE